MANKITAIILTKNEKDAIEACLKALEWCDQRLVVDDYSIDGTARLARLQGVHVFKHHLDQDFARQRNDALEQVKTEWALFVDADERVTEELKEEILQAVTDPTIQGYRLKRQDFFLDKQLTHGETGAWHEVRLARKEAGHWHGKVHEVWNIYGEVGELRHPLLHYPHESISNFLLAVNRYSSLAAEQFFEEGQRSSVWAIMGYPVAKFVRNYIYLGGFWDGTAGFVHAMIMSFHSYMVRSKLYLLQKRK